MFTVTAEDLESRPEYGVAILNFALHERRHHYGFHGIDDPTDKLFRELEFHWIYGEKIRSKEALAPVIEDGYLVQRGRRGRPVAPTRRAAINAYIRRLYLEKSWLEITRRVCPCGDSHRDSNAVVAVCQPTIKTQVMVLKRLLKKCSVQLSGELPAKAILAEDW